MTQIRGFVLVFCYKGFLYNTLQETNNIILFKAVEKMSL